jgi:tRNA U34 5-carboxymethylaminomethyl modifying GTPase MnmE/TrmE
MVAEEIRLAMRGLAALTGHISADAVLERIFARFCIGK